MKVRFYFPEEFLRELSADGPPSKIVRLTAAYLPTTYELVRTVKVVAGYVNVRGELVELSYAVGEQMRTVDHEDPASAQTEARRNKAFDEITNAANGLGVEIRAGRFEETA